MKRKICPSMLTRQGMATPSASPQRFATSLFAAMRLCSCSPSCADRTDASVIDAEETAWNAKQAQVLQQYGAAPADVDNHPDC
jgi:hypothetical protein